MERVLSLLLALSLIFALSACEKKDTTTNTAINSNAHTKCINCGVNVTATDKFCGECGFTTDNTATICVNCGEEITTADKFCSKCGYAIDNASTTDTYNSNEATADIFNSNMEGVTSSYSSNTPSSSQQSFLQNEKKCYSVGCNNSINGFGMYCYEHVCSKSSCRSQKDLLSNYCSMHKCMSISCDNAKSKMGSYCYEHTCLKGSCISQKGASSNYCFTHRCMSSSCENAKSETGDYCYEHACAKNGCNFEKSFLSDYCFVHK